MMKNFLKSTVSAFVLLNALAIFAPSQAMEEGENENSSYAPSLMAIPSPDLDIHNDIDWKSQSGWSKAYVDATRKVGKYTYRWLSLKDFAVEKHAIKAIHSITSEADNFLTCTYDVVLTDGAHEETETIDIYLYTIQGFGPTNNLTPSVAQKLVDEYDASPRHYGSVQEDGHSWELESLTEERTDRRFRVTNVEFIENSQLHRDGKGGGRIESYYRFSARGGSPYFEATFGSYLIP